MTSMTPQIRLMPTATSAMTPPNISPLTTDCSTISSVIVVVPPRRSSSRRARAEVGAAHCLAGQQLLAAALDPRLALLEHVRAVAHLERAARVLLDHHHRGARGANLQDLVEDQIHDERGQAHRGLVQQEEPGSEQERAPDLEHSSLAPAQAFRPLLASLGEPWEEGEHTLDVLADLSGGLAHVGAELEVLLDRHPGKQARPLHDVGDALLQKGGWTQTTDRFPAEADRSLPGRQEAGDRLEERRLARAVRTEHRHQLAGLDPQRDSAQHVEASIARVHVVDGQHAGHGYRASRRRPSRGGPKYDSSTAGLLRSASGVPSAMTRPMASAYMRLDRPITASMLCSMRTMVVPRSLISRSRVS